MAAQLKKETVGFLKQLEKNNCRDWFNGNKSAYQAALETMRTCIRLLVIGFNLAAVLAPAISDAKPDPIRLQEAMKGWPWPQFGDSKPENLSKEMETWREKGWAQGISGCGVPRPGQPEVGLYELAPEHEIESFCVGIGRKDLVTMVKFVPRWPPGSRLPKQLESLGVKAAGLHYATGMGYIVATDSPVFFLAIQPGTAQSGPQVSTVFWLNAGLDDMERSFPLPFSPLREECQQDPHFIPRPTNVNCQIAKEEVSRLIARANPPLADDPAGAVFFEKSEFIRAFKKSGEENGLKWLELWPWWLDISADVARLRWRNAEPLPPEARQERERARTVLLRWASQLESDGVPGGAGEIREFVAIYFDSPEWQPREAANRSDAEWDQLGRRRDELIQGLRGAAGADILAAQFASASERQKYLIQAQVLEQLRHFAAKGAKESVARLQSLAAEQGKAIEAMLIPRIDAAVKEERWATAAGLGFIASWAMGEVVPPPASSGAKAGTGRFGEARGRLAAWLNLVLPRNASGDPAVSALDKGPNSFWTACKVVTIAEINAPTWSELENRPNAPTLKVEPAQPSGLTQIVGRYSVEEEYVEEEEQIVHKDPEGYQSVRGTLEAGRKTLAYMAGMELAPGETKQGQVGGAVYGRGLKDYGAKPRNSNEKNWSYRETSTWTGTWQSDKSDHFTHGEVEAQREKVRNLESQFGQIDGQWEKKKVPVKRLRFVERERQVWNGAVTRRIAVSNGSLTGGTVQTTTLANEFYDRGGGLADHFLTEAELIASVVKRDQDKPEMLARSIAMAFHDFADVERRAKSREKNWSAGALEEERKWTSYFLAPDAVIPEEEGLALRLVPHVSLKLVSALAGPGNEREIKRNQENIQSGNAGISADQSRLDAARIARTQAIDALNALKNHGVTKGREYAAAESRVFSAELDIRDAEASVRQGFLQQRQLQGQLSVEQTVKENGSREFKHAEGHLRIPCVAAIEEVSADNKSVRLDRGRRQGMKAGAVYKLGKFKSIQVTEVFEDYSLGTGSVAPGALVIRDDKGFGMGGCFY